MRSAPGQEAPGGAGVPISCWSVPESSDAPPLGTQRALVRECLTRARLERRATTRACNGAHSKKKDRAMGGHKNCSRKRPLLLFDRHVVQRRHLLGATAVHSPPRKARSKLAIAVARSCAMGSLVSLARTEHANARTFSLFQRDAAATTRDVPERCSRCLSDW